MLLLDLFKELFAVAFGFFASWLTEMVAGAV